MRPLEEVIADPEISIEARSIMYTRTTIWFRADCDRFSKFFESFPQESQPLVRSMLIDYDCFDLMCRCDNSLIAASEHFPRY